jgi:phosphoglycerate transport regulatory protein PgtC
MKRLQRVLGMVACLMGLQVQAKTQLTVMTSYPESVVSRFEEAFESRYPDIRLQILWRMPFDALPYLLQARQGGVDVYWTPSQRNFLTLKAAGALGPIGIDREGLPEIIGGGRVSDPQHYYLASETAGYGLYYSPERLRQLGVQVPEQWRDLTGPRYRGEVALPVPSGVGYAHMLVDQLLQSEGWVAGWNLWRGIARNSRLMMSRGNFVTDEVAAGRSAVGLTMDFFAQSSRARGAGGAFVYPRKTAFNPAQIAITAATPHRAEAELFVSFILSEAGQSLLFLPEIRKLPIRPSVYAQAPEGYANPFTLEADLSYDAKKGITRRGLNAVLFDAAITHQHAHLIEAWDLLEQAQKDASPVERERLEEAYAALTSWPIEEPDETSELARACLNRADEPGAEAVCAEAEQVWNGFFQEAYAQAISISKEILAQRGVTGP